MQTLDGDRVIAAAERGARQFCAVLERADRPDARAVGAWRVRDVGAHLTGITAYTAMLRGVPSRARTIDGIADPCRAAGCTATFDVRLRGSPPARAVLAFVRGQLTVQPDAGQPADCRISADPATYLLIAYGRSGPLVPALTGKITAVGRKPWLGLTLPRLFRKP